MGLTIKRRRVWHSDPVDADKRVIASRLCIRCGTNLRGCSVEAGCPTCQHPVYDSVYGGFLIDASPFEPRRLYELSSIVLYPALFLGGLLTIMILVSMAAARDFVTGVNSVFQAGFFCAMLSPLIALVGIVIFTGRYSADYYRARYGNPRFIISATLTLMALIAVVIVAVSLWGTYASAVIQVAFATIPAAIFLRSLASLMRRVPNKKLATFAGLTLALSVGLGAAALGILILEPIANLRQDLRGLLIALTFLVDVGGVGLTLSILRLLVSARRTLLAIQPH